MESAIVCAAKQFIGFELCKDLLNRGFNVFAIDHEQYLERVQLEKWLEIGRNSNLINLSIEESFDDIDSQAVCFIPFVDFLGYRDPSIINDWMNTIERLLQGNKIVEYAIIFPSQILKSSFEKSSYERRLFEILEDKCRNKKVVEFYVPTLYGPWQPNTYLFQQLIEGNPKEEYLDDRNDAIFIEDAVKEIVESSFQVSNEQKILLENSQPNTWKNCILYLNDSYLLPEEDCKRDDTKVQLRKVQEKIPYQEGLTLQLACYKRAQQ